MLFQEVYALRYVQYRYGGFVFSPVYAAGLIGSNVCLVCVVHHREIGAFQSFLMSFRTITRVGKLESDPTVQQEYCSL